MWIVVCVAATGCAQPRSTTPQRTAALRLTNNEFGRAHSYQTIHVDVPFRLANQGVSGTMLLLRYMQDLQGSGALYVSNLQVALQMRHNGTPIECVSKIVLADGSRPAEAVIDAAPNTSGETEYETTVKPWQPGSADAWVVDSDLVCKHAADQVIANVASHDNGYDPEIKRLTDPDDSERADGVYAKTQTDVVIDYERCTSTPTRRFVHRYEHFLATRYTPPDLEQLQRRYADGKLSEAPPVCHEIELAGGQHLRHHIEADVHYPGPSHGTVEPELTPSEARTEVESQPAVRVR